jgi:hypothetical protein
MNSSDEEEINQHNTNTNTNTDIVVDLLSLNLDDTGEECMICKEELSCYPCYELPECKHKYHTHCLIAWFRNGDSRCPYCGNKGINNKNKQNKLNNYGGFYGYHIRPNSYETNLLNDLRKYAYNKKHELDKNAINIKKNFEKIKIMEENYKIFLKTKREYKASLKKENVNFNEAKKKLSKYRSEQWNYVRKINNEKYKLIKNSYIVPLIIPTTLDMS